MLSNAHITIFLQILLGKLCLTSDIDKNSSSRQNRPLHYGITLKESIMKGYNSCREYYDEVMTNLGDLDKEERDKENQSYQNWRKTHNFEQKPNTHDATLDAAWTEGPMSKEELAFLQKEGYLPPGILPYAPKELMDRVAAEAKKYQESLENGTSVYGGTNYINWFIPSIAELMAKNSDYLLEIGKQVLGEDHDALIAPHLIHVPKGKGKATLHNDWTSTSLWNDNDAVNFTDYYINGYISLTQTSAKSSPLFIYPRTHGTFMHSDTTSQHVLKNYKVSDEYKELMYRTLWKSHSLPVRKSQEAAAGEKHVYGIGMCAAYQWYENEFDSENIRGVYMETSQGEMTMFNPGVMHSSEWANENDEPRMSLVLVFINSKSLSNNYTYYFMNNKYYLGDFVNLFTNQLKWAKENMLYKVDEIVDTLALYYKQSKEKVKGCIDEKRFFKDDQYMSYGNTTKGTNSPLVSLKDTHEILVCIMKSTEGLMSHNEVKFSEEVKKDL